MKKIFYNGQILTMEKNMYVDAIFIEDGIIKKIGSTNEILALKDKDTEIINLDGKTLMPSFIDPHSHITALTNTLAIVPLESAKSFNDIINLMKKFKKDNNINDDTWIIGFGYDHNELEEKAHPTRDILDKISIYNPIMIAHASGHLGSLNSAALKALNINGSTKDPNGGLIGREKNSNIPNGYLEENAFIQLTSKVPKPTLEDMSKLFNEAQNIYLQYGITTVQDGLIKENEFNLLNYFAENNLIKVDVIGYVDLKNSKNILNNNKYLNNYINRFKINGYKIFQDDSPQGKTAWLTKPYEDSTNGYSGYPIYTDDEVYEFIKTALSENVQILSHCNGDAACQQFIKSYKKALNNTNTKDSLRPVMIHSQTLRYDQIDEVKKINMIPSYFVGHTYFWGDIHIKNLGIDRAFKISPANTSLKKDVLFTFHQDTPVTPPNMLHTIWCAVNRITKNGIVLGKDECISVLDALKAVTINAAYQYFEEDKKGSIKEGKLADLIILDKNPLKVDSIDIKNITILETIKEGVTLYSK